MLALNEKYFEVVLTNQIRYNTFYFTFCFDFRIELNYDLRKLLHVKEKNFLFHSMFWDLLLVGTFGVPLSGKNAITVRTSWN
jgi:hypothetical protein